MLIVNEERVDEDAKWFVDKWLFDTSLKMV